MAFFKKSFVFGVISLAALGLVACGDDGSANGPAGDENLTEESSSSSLATSSSSTPIEDLGSSSSNVIASEAKQSSSSVASSSSAKSSSSVVSSSSIKYGSLTDVRDGQVYKTVTIGTQTWMAENLNYDPGDVSSMGSYAWSVCYDNESANCDKYGRLYTWEVAMNNAACAYGKTCSPSGVQQGICPEGWHLPSNDDWKVLWTAVGGTSTAGTKLKSTSGWNSNGNGEDAYGFSVLPAGLRYDGGSFFDQGYYANFWSSSEYNSDIAWDWYFSYSNASVYQSLNYKNLAFSVRCLKDSF